MHPYAVTETEAEAKKRERLIEEHLPQVHLIARRFHEKLPSSVCLRRPDLDRRNRSDLSHRQLRSAAERETADLRRVPYPGRDPRQPAQHGLGIPPSPPKGQGYRNRDSPGGTETASRPHGRPDRVPRWACRRGLSRALVEIQGMNLESLDMTTSPSGNKTLLALCPIRKRICHPIFWSDPNSNVSLAKCIAEIPEKEKTVISLYYLEELTLREIAEVMDLHISRVAHLKSTALLRLRSQMKAHWNRTRWKIVNRENEPILGLAPPGRRSSAAPGGHGGRTADARCARLPNRTARSRVVETTTRRLSGLSRLDRSGHRNVHWTGSAHPDGSGRRLH